MNAISVAVQNLSYAYSATAALRDVSLELPAHQIIGVAGTNGSGKSTLLKLMAGLLHPARGRILIEGRPVDRRMGHRVAWASDAGALYRFYTVAEMLAFYRGVFPDFNPERANDLLAFMELSHATRVSGLSKGNAARLKIVLTLARDCSVILMDEPLSGLDPLVRDAVVKSLIAFVDLNRQTVIMATHELAEVQPLLDRVVLLDHGRLVAFDTVEQIESRGYAQGLTGWMAEQIRRS